jgi:hypothetical protein
MEQIGIFITLAVSSKIIIKRLRIKIENIVRN